MLIVVNGKISRYDSIFSNIMNYNGSQENASIITNFYSVRYNATWPDSYVGTNIYRPSNNCAAGYYCSASNSCSMSDVNHIIYFALICNVSISTHQAFINNDR